MRFASGVCCAVLSVAGTACGGSAPSSETSGAVQAGSSGSNRVEALLQLGTTAYAAGQFDSARSVWSEALALAIPLHDSTMQARLLTEMAFALRRLGDLDAARARAESALALKTRLDMRAELSRSLNLLGLIDLSDNRNASAARWFERAVGAAAEVNDAEGIAKATSNAGLAYGYMGDLRRARAGHRALRRAGRDIGNAYYEGNALANEALVDISEGDARSALARLDTARALYRRAPKERVAGEQNALLHRATVLEMIGDYTGAFAAFDTSLTLARAHALVEPEIFVLRLLAGLHRRIGDHPRALGYYEQAERLARANGIESDLAAILRGAAESRALAGNVPGALRDAEEAYRLHLASEETLEQIADLVLLAELEARRGRVSGAANRLAAAETLANRTGDRVSIAQVALARAREADRKGDARAILRALRRLDSTTSMLDFETEWSAAALAARAYARVGALDSAVVQGRRAVHAIDALRGELSLEPMRSSLLAERANVYGDHVLTLLRLGRTDEAFQVSDRARSRALLERLTAVGAGSDEADVAVPRELVQGEELLRRIDALVRALRQAPAPARPRRGTSATDGGDDVAAQLASARSEYEALIMRAGRRNARSTAVLGAGMVTVGDVRSALHPSEILVEYFVAPDRIIIFVGTPDTLHVLQRPMDHKVLAHRIRLLRDVWAAPRPDWDTGLPASRSLHRDLIAPLDSAGLLASAARLVIVPHGLLAQLPFAALQSERTARFVAEDHAVTHAPSAAAFVAARGERMHEATSEPAEGLAPFDRELPASAGEVRAFAASVAGARARIGASATEAALRQALASEGIVHVATHGVMNGHNPMFSRIQLARPRRGAGSGDDDGRFEVWELLRMDVHSALVFLSGCETGAAGGWMDQPVRGRGDLPLSQALLSAGARSVVSTLWRLDDANAGVFASRFYELLREVTSADALVLAQRQFIGNVRTRDPYYWAAYVLSGDGRYSLTAQSARQHPSTKR